MANFFLWAFALCGFGLMTFLAAIGGWLIFKAWKLSFEIQLLEYRALKMKKASQEVRNKMRDDLLKNLGE